MKVFVAGIGGVGSAALFHLAKRGAEAVAFDRYLPGHDRGSSHGETRIIRMAYFEHPDYVPLLRRSYELWNELEHRSGKRLFHQVGLLQVGPENGAVVSGVLRSAKTHLLDVDLWSRHEVLKRFPSLRVRNDLCGVYERTGGYLEVESCVRTHVHEALALGARLHVGPKHAMLAWEATARGVRVTFADGSTDEADGLIVTPGPWAPKALGELGVRLELRRKHLYWFRAEHSGFDKEGGFPTFLFELPNGVFYGFPSIPGQGLKVAEHTGGTIVPDIDHDDRVDEPRSRENVVKFVGEQFIGVAAQPIRHEVCHYTMSPDEHFIVDRHPACERVVFAMGLSGHGFKFTAVLGETLAEMTLGSRPSCSIDFLNRNRFSHAPTI